MIRPARTSDHPSVTRLYCRYMYESYLCSLGEPFIGLVCSELIASEAAVTFVCVEDGRVCGFISSTTDIAALFFRILSRHCFRLSAMVIRAVLARRFSLSGLYDSLSYPLRRPFARRRCAEMLFIAIDETSRGRGYAARLIERTLEEMRARSVSRVNVACQRSNSRVRDILENMGFREEAGFDIFGREMLRYSRGL